VKGAPDRLLDRSPVQRDAEGGTGPLDRDAWERTIGELGDRGLRVLGAAVRDEDEGKTDLSADDLGRDLVFLGVVGIVDPPRPEAIEAIAACHRAGIRVMMITDDHAGTARAIGKEMGIGDGGHAVTGEELEAASDEELRRIVGEADVFARTGPEHKLRLVTALQANGEVVAMTGATGSTTPPP
jgi:magnesium-transporting ATPase (P-type)